MKGTGFRRPAGVTLALGVWLMAAGCSQPLPMMRVGTNLTPFDEPLRLADDLNYLKNRNQYRFVEYADSEDIVQAFRNGIIESGSLSLEDALELAEDLPDLRIVLVLEAASKADPGLSRKGREQMTSLPGDSETLIRVLAVRGDYLEKNRAHVFEFVRSYFQAQQFAARFPAQVYPYSIERLRLSPEEGPKILQQITPADLAQNRHLLGSPPALRELAKPLVTRLLQSQLLHAPPNWETLIDRRVIGCQNPPALPP